MQRIRMSLPYFEAAGWEAEVVMVNEQYVDMVKDPLLLESLPPHIPIHKVKALSKKWTSKLGLGSLALRSLWFYRRKVNQLLSQNRFDLVYFSTTEFPVAILGAYWKRRFGVPYVIDMQDPWHSDYYQKKPKSERPKKYWFSYRLHKYLEPKAMKHVDGLISVSKSYLDTLHERYPILKTKPAAVITFGAFDIDFSLAAKHIAQLQPTDQKEDGSVHLVYVGRGGYDMQKAATLLFSNFKRGLDEQPELFSRVKMHFIGTSYAPRGQGRPTLAPIAAATGMESYVTEHTDRIGFYQSISKLQQAHGLLLIGSDQAAYTASKLYPYILAKKPLLALLHPQSSAASIMKQCKAGQLISLTEPEHAFQILGTYLQDIKNGTGIQTDWKEFEAYTARYLTGKQAELFNQVITSTTTP